MAVILPSGVSYEPTASDRLWLLRAVQREGQPRRRVAQTLVNRFAWLYPKGHYSTLASFVRAYAQPVNPRWYPDGDLHAAAVNRVRNHRDLSASDKAESIGVLQAHAVRRRDVIATETHFDKEVFEAVDRALQKGPIDIAPGTVHFAAPSIRRAWPVTHESRSFKANRFYQERDGLSGTYLYRVQAPPPVAVRSGFGAVVVAFFIALFGLARRSRG